MTIEMGVSRITAFLGVVVAAVALASCTLVVRLDDLTGGGADAPPGTDSGVDGSGTGTDAASMEGGDLDSGDAEGGVVGDAADAAAVTCVTAAPWGIRYGNAGFQAAQASAIGASGVVAMAGIYEGTIQVHNGIVLSDPASHPLFSAFIVKTDADGKSLWAVRSIGEGTHRATAVEFDSAGNILVSGYFDGTFNLGGGAVVADTATDVFVTKLDPSGKHLWSKYIKGLGAQYARTMAVDAADNVLLGVDTNGTVDYGTGPFGTAGSTDVLIVKYAPTGALVWGALRGDAGGQTISDIAVDSANNVFVSGTMAGSIDFGTGALVSAGGTDGYVAKLSPAGKPLFAARFGSATGDEAATSVAVTGAGEMLIGGAFNATLNVGGSTFTSAGNIDIFLVKLDSSGKHLWSKTFGSPGDQRLLLVRTDQSANVVLTGNFDGMLDFGGGVSSSYGDDIFLATLDPLGAYIYSRRFGNAATQEVRGMAIDPCGHAILSGAFASVVDFGGAPLTSAGLEDIFLARFDTGP